MQDPRDALVRPFVAGRCDGDTLPIHRHVSRAVQVGMRIGLIDPILASVCGPIPFQGLYAIGHECVAEVIETGPSVKGLQRGGRDRPVGGLVWQLPRMRTRAHGEMRHHPHQLPGRLRFRVRERTMGRDGGRRAPHPVRRPHAGARARRSGSAAGGGPSDNLSDAWRSVVPVLRERPGGRVLILGGAAQSIGLYAAGLAVRHGAEIVDYVDDRPERLAIAEKFGARVHEVNKGKRTAADIPRRDYDIAVEGTSNAAGVDLALRSLAPGGVCQPVGWYLPPGTKVPLMHMFVNDATLKISAASVRPLLPELLHFVAEDDFPAELVTTLTADWDDAPEAYKARTAKLVLHRPRLGATA
jgi:threonine dehydrogenase-like Zn-dependent dehydrogenase